MTDKNAKHKVSMEIQKVDSNIANTVSEIKDVKHTFRAGVKARQGVDL